VCLASGLGYRTIIVCTEGIWNLQQQQRQQRIDRATAGTIGRLQSNTRVAIYIAWNGMAESDKEKSNCSLYNIQHQNVKLK
jgi:hypothetical protein